MKAVVLKEITEAKDICLSEIAIPKAKAGWVVVKVKAFGLNHSEQILRLNEIEADYIQKPIVPGIECVGEVYDVVDGPLQKGQKVIALMGGMGRSFNGGYEEYALLPQKQVFAINSNLPWDKIGAIPETYFTAWGSLFECLQLKKEDSLLVRGGTCALGYAAIQIAKALGCRVVATTHRQEKLQLLKDAGADEYIMDDGKLRLKNLNVNKVLELVGAKTIYDSLYAVNKGGIVCNTGILGGVFALDNFDPIKDIPNGVYLTGFFSNYPTQKDVDEIFDFINKHNLVPQVGEVFDFENVKEAIIAQDGGKVNGKIVVVI
jgi:NADPH:quinone reductase-like Zn-dependent oxidoreductase